jgi:phosphoserine phosphatase
MNPHTHNDFPLLHPSADPNSPIVATDLEGTLTAGVTVLGIHRYLETHGRAAVSKAITRRRMGGFIFRKLLRLDLREYKNEWMREVTRVFAGEPVEAVREMADWVVEQVTWEDRRKAVLVELEAHLAAGRRVILVTGVFDLFLERLLARLPGMEAIGTGVVGNGELFSGELADFNVGRRKVDNLKRLTGGTGRLYSAYGDTYSDLAMLSLSDRPVAVFPDRKLRSAAENAGWRILAG